MSVAELGGRVIAVGRNTERLEETVAMLEGSGHVAEAFDLAQNPDITKWLQGIADNHGPLSGLVHCAGISSIMPLRFLRDDDVDRVLDINLKAAMYLVRGFRVKSVSVKPASVVLMSSVMAAVGQPGMSLYSASKSALSGFARSLALELADEGIRINCIAPAFVKTKMLEETQKTVSEQQMQKIEARHPLGFGEPSDIGNATVFLLSKASRWVTGTTLFVDGGYTAH